MQTMLLMTAMLACGQPDDTAAKRELVDVAKSLGGLKAALGAQAEVAKEWKTDEVKMLFKEYRKAVEAFVSSAETGLAGGTEDIFILQLGLIRLSRADLDEASAAKSLPTQIKDMKDFKFALGKEANKETLALIKDGQTIGELAHRADDLDRKLSRYRGILGQVKFGKDAATVDEAWIKFQVGISVRFAILEERLVSDKDRAEVLRDIRALEKAVGEVENSAASDDPAQVAKALAEHTAKPKK